jgi:hypothetical protein
MSDPNHTELRRDDATFFVALNLLGLAGLCVLVACLASDAGLWPSFSGDRVFAADAFAPEQEWAAPAAAQPERKPAAPVYASAPLGISDADCGARAKRQERAAARRQLMRRARLLRLLSRRRTAPPDTDVVDG